MAWIQLRVQNDNKTFCHLVFGYNLQPFYAAKYTGISPMFGAFTIITRMDYYWHILNKKQTLRMFTSKWQLCKFMLCHCASISVLMWFVSYYLQYQWSLTNSVHLGFATLRLFCDCSHVRVTVLIYSLENVMKWHYKLQHWLGGFFCKLAKSIILQLFCAFF